MDLSNLLGDDDDLGGVLLFDYSQIAISTIMNTYTETDVIDANLIRHIILSSIKFNVIKHKQAYPNIVIAIDNGSGGYWRRLKYDFYKRSREKKRIGDSWDWESIFDAMRVVAEEFRENMPYKTLILPHTEADDIIGVLINYISGIDPTTPIMIVSSDGDFTQCHKHKNVKQWSPMHKKWVHPKHGTPQKDLLTKIVKGDTKDCVSNVYMPSDFLYTKLEGERQKPISAKFMATVFESKDPESLFTGDALIRYRENKELIDFDEIPDNIREAIIKEYNEIVVPPRRKVYPYFVKKGIKKLLDHVNDF